MNTTKEEGDVDMKMTLECASKHSHTWLSSDKLINANKKRCKQAPLQYIYSAILSGIIYIICILFNTLLIF